MTELVSEPQRVQLRYALLPYIYSGRTALDKLLEDVQDETGMFYQGCAARARHR